MKNLFLFLGAIIILLASCKKQNPEPAFIGNAIPTIKPYYTKYYGWVRYTQDSIRNKQLTDTIPTVKRKGYIKGFIHGFGSGAAVTKGVEVITNLR